MVQAGGTLRRGARGASEGIHRLIAGRCCNGFWARSGQIRGNPSRSDQIQETLKLTAIDLLAAIEVDVRVEALHPQERPGLHTFEVTVEERHIAAAGVLHEVLGPGRATGVEGAVEHPARVFVYEKHFAARVGDRCGHDAPRRHRAGAEGLARIHPATGAEIHPLLFTERAGARTAVRLVRLLKRGVVNAAWLA